MILIFVSKMGRLGEGFSSAFYMQGQFEERRQTGRTDLKQVVRIRPVDSQFPSEYCTTFNVSEAGLYLVTSASHYVLGMNLE